MAFRRRLGHCVYPKINFAAGWPEKIGPPPRRNPRKTFEIAQKPNAVRRSRLVARSVCIQPQPRNGFRSETPTTLGWYFSTSVCQAETATRLEDSGLPAGWEAILSLITAQAPSLRACVLSTIYNRTPPRNLTGLSELPYISDLGHSRLLSHILKMD